MNDLDRSLVATLAYYAAFGRALTLLDLRERLIPAPRLGGRSEVVTLGDLLTRLEILEKIGSIVQQSGLYTLAPASDEIVGVRVEQEKIWAQKWRRMRRRAWWLQFVPYVRGLYASGSLALGNMTVQSDWDVFVIARAGRMFTARTGLLIAAWLMVALRTKHDSDTCDKFCFNHSVTTDGLTLRHRSLFVAHSLATLVPIYDPQHYLERLWQANQWLADFIPQPTRAESVRRSVGANGLGTIAKRFLELILNTFVGDALEYLLRTWQQRRIAHDPATHARGGRIIYTDRELEFHPRSFEAVALARYNASLERLGLAAHSERDSGLRH